jgi:hypothetical protein
MEEGVGEDAKSGVLDIVSTVFKPNAHSNIKRVGVAYLAPVLETDPSLMPLFLTVLLSFDRSSDRAALLGLNNMTSSFQVCAQNSYFTLLLPSGKACTTGFPFHSLLELTRSLQRGATMELPVAGSSGMTYVVHPMNGASVARGLADLVAAGGGVFYEEHAQVLLGCVVASEDVAGNGWGEIWDSFKHMVVDSMIVGGVADIAADIIYSLASQNDQIAKSIIEGDLLGGGLVEDIFKQASDVKCQEGFVVLASKLANFSPGCCKYVESLLDKSEGLVEGNDDLRNLRDDLKR